MRGVAADEHAAVAETVGNQAAANPILFADDLVVEVGADAEDRADRPVAIDAVELGFIRLKIIVDQPVSWPSMATVVPQRRGLSDMVIQAGFCVIKSHQIRRMDIGRLHALHDIGAGKARADRFADEERPPSHPTR